MREEVPGELPAGVREKLIALTAEFGLHYAAADFIVTPGEKHVFLEINAAGEWFWLQERAGLPIAQAIADVLTSAPGARRINRRLFCGDL